MRMLKKASVSLFEEEPQKGLLTISCCEALDTKNDIEEEDNDKRRVEDVPHLFTGKAYD